MESQNDLYLLLYMMLYILAAMTGTTDSRYCSESRTTWQVVQSCPTSKTEVKERARKRNCDSLAMFQNCTAPSKFKYHCLINAKETQLVEVCAPVYYILGFCAEYNYDGARIQDHYNRRCTNYSQPCPNRYISTDAYQFPGCYKLLHMSGDITIAYANVTTSKNDIFKQDDYRDFSVRIALVAVVASAATIVAIILAASFWRFKVTSSGLNLEGEQKTGEEEIEMAEISNKSTVQRVENPSTKIRALTKVIETLKFKRCVVIIGDRGDGKTILAHYANGEMRKKRGKIPLKINNYTELDELVPGRNNLVIVIDNLFREFSSFDVAQWSTRLRSMKAMVAKSTNRNCLIITLQTEIFSQICLDSDIKDFLGDVMVDIGVGGKYHLTDQEKKQLHNRKSLEESPPLADKCFPLCCQWQHKMKRAKHESISFLHRTKKTQLSTYEEFEMDQLSM